MKVIFLGTNGWYDTDTGNTCSILIDTIDKYIVLDAGNGIYKLDQYINEDKPIYLFISHLHIDHIVGLHILDKFNFNQKITIIVPKSTREALEIFVNHPYSSPLKNKKTKIELIEIVEGEHSIPFKIDCKKLNHVDLDFGYRLQLEDKIITYCTDTSPCDNDSLLAKDADLLIHECSMLPGISLNGWGHTNPEEAAMVALESNVKQLILTHFTACEYKTLAQRDGAQVVAAEIFANTIAAKDDLIINL